MRTDTVIGGGLLAFAAAYGYLTLKLPVQPMEHTLGPAFLPKLLTGLLILLTILLLLQARHAPTPKASPLALGARGRLVALGALMATYAAGMGLAGYLLTTPFFLAGTIWLAGERRPLRICLWTAVLFAGIHLLLRVIFRVPLPLGPLD